MSLWRQLTRGVRVLTRREAADDELDDEVRDYLDQATEAYIERGRSPAEARRAARRDMGSTVSVREQVRDHGWENVISTLVTDMRFAGRMLRKSPVFTLVMVIVIGLGSGAVTTIFSAMNATVLRPLPGVSEPDGLVTVRLARRDGSEAEQGSYRSTPTFATAPGRSPASRPGAGSRSPSPLTARAPSSGPTW